MLSFLVSRFNAQLINHNQRWWRRILSCCVVWVSVTALFTWCSSCHHPPHQKRTQSPSAPSSPQPAHCTWANISVHQPSSFMYSYWNLRLEQRHIFHPESGPPHPQVPVAALDVVHTPPGHLPLLLLLFLCKLNICLFIKHQYIPTIILSTAEHSSMNASLAASLLLSILSIFRCG